MDIDNIIENDHYEDGVIHGHIATLIQMVFEIEMNENIEMADRDQLITLLSDVIAMLNSY